MVRGLAFRVSGLVFQVLGVTFGSLDDVLEREAHLRNALIVVTLKHLEFVIQHSTPRVVNAPGAPTVENPSKLSVLACIRMYVQGLGFRVLHRV